MPKVVRLQTPNPGTAPDRGGRPALISREKILDAARPLRSHELTMNAVAEALGVKKASLYYHFNSRQDLIMALSLEVVQEMKIPDADPAHWRRWLSQAATGLFDMLSGHPIFFELENLIQYARAGLPLQEAAMETLEEAGFSRDDGVIIWRLIASHAYVAATSVHEARSLDMARYTSEGMRVLEEAERVRPMPRVRALMARGNEPDQNHRFAKTLAWQIKSLPDPQTSKRSKKVR